MNAVGTLVVLALLRAGDPPDEFQFRHGPLELAFDGESGRLSRVALSGEILAVPPAGAAPVSFALGPADKILWLEQMKLPRRLVRRDQPAPDTLELTVRAGDYELLERYRLFADRPRLDRSARLVNRGTETVKLRGLAFRTGGVKAGGEGFYRFPRQWPPRSYPFSGMQPERRRGRGGSLDPVLAQLAPGRTVLWVSYGEDSPGASVKEGRGEFEVSQNHYALGYLRPNQPQDVGFSTMEVVAADYWGALPHLWRWMDSAGLKVPADRPEWIRQAVLYSFHPGGTIGSNWSDLGGFPPAAEKLLPSIGRLGATAVWILPVEQKSPYWPFDYYRFADGLGTAEEYRRLVARAHEMNLRVLQDLVPHGGSPKAVHNVQHPEFMLRREDGTTLNYWLNDFAWPGWQDYIAGVADHYVRRYGIDGYRIDACYGSKETNWNPDAPHVRASRSGLWGGLGMVRRIREAVRALKPVEGAVLAEVESPRHLAVSDAEYDFGFCYALGHGWRRLPPAEYVAALQEYLEEQKYAEPAGAVRLRHVESHDSLRSELWYGIEGMRAMYALSAWIDGMPMIYQEMERGHGFEIGRINAIRKARPELSTGEAFYRAVECGAPGVFTCLRRLGERASVVAINFNPDPVRARLKWPGGQGEAELRPLGYAVLPGPEGPAKASGGAAAAPGATPQAGGIAFEGAREWFVDTVGGRLWDRFVPLRGSGKPGRGGIYWRAQGTDAVWENRTHPLHPAQGRLGVRGADGGWTIVRPPDGSAPLQLLERPAGLFLEGPGSQAAGIEAAPVPPAPDVTLPVNLGGVTLRCVGPDFIIGNARYTATLRRQGGVIRRLAAGGGAALALDHDLYGDQAYFEHPEEKRMAASNDVECGMRLWTDAAGLHLSFEGQIRGFNRFVLKRPPLGYRVEYTFDGSPAFEQRWTFRTEKAFKDQQAFLAAILTVAEAERFRFLRDGQAVSEDALADAKGRRGAGEKPPTRVEFLKGNRCLWALSGLQVPPGRACGVFVQGRQFFLTLLDGPGASMDKDAAYEFRARWEVSGP